MDDLLAAITDLVSNQKPDRLVSLAELIKQCDSADATSNLSTWPTTSKSKQQLEKIILLWESSSVSSLELASMIIGASYAYNSAKDEETVELVWTGPSTPMMSTRRTEQALIEVIDSATHDLFLVSFVAYEVANVTAALNKAIDRGVEVSILLEPADTHGGQIKTDCFQTMREAVPQASLYVWSKQSKDEMGGGYRLVHAKCSVADGRVAFITSANLTVAALERNMELGVLISGNHTPNKLYAHLQSLITTKTIHLYQ